MYICKVDVIPLNGVILTGVFGHRTFTFMGGGCCRNDCCLGSGGFWVRGTWICVGVAGGIDIVWGMGGSGWGSLVHSVFCFSKKLKM